MNICYMKSSVSSPVLSFENIANNSLTEIQTSVSSKLMLPDRGRQQRQQGQHSLLSVCLCVSLLYSEESWKDEADGLKDCLQAITSELNKEASTTQQEPLKGLWKPPKHKAGFQVLGYKGDSF